MKASYCDEYGVTYFKNKYKEFKKGQLKELDTEVKTMTEPPKGKLKD